MGNNFMEAHSCFVAKEKVGLFRERNLLRNRQRPFTPSPLKCNPQIAQNPFGEGFVRKRQCVDTGFSMAGMSPLAPSLGPPLR